MENTSCFGGSNMGVCDAASSRLLELSFADLERVINLILEDCQERPGLSYDTLLPQPLSLPDFLIEEKSNYFNKVSSTIVEAKHNFSQFYENTNKNIEEMTREILVSVKAREKQLKAELQEVKEKKMAKWNQQLEVCQKALKLLRSPYGKKDSMTAYSEELEFVDPGEVKLEALNYSTVINGIENMGKITHTVACNPGLDSVKSMTPKFLFGDGGEKPGRFCRAWGICSDATGRILVCDRSNHRIQIFNECGEFLIQFGKEGSKPGEFNRPTGIDVDEKCRIVVADKDNHRIQVFTYSGCYLFAFGRQGTAAGQFMYPWDVATNKNCDIAVSDSKNHRVQLFNWKGDVLTIFDAQTMGIRHPRAALRCLDSPRGLAFRPDGCLLVTDFNNHRVLLLNKDFSKFFVIVGKEGMKPGQFFRPQGIACDKFGRFAVSDSKNYRIQVFDTDGKLLRVFGTKGDGPGHFDCPQGISIHPNQNILVVDLNNNRVQVF